MHWWTCTAALASIVVLCGCANEEPATLQDIDRTTNATNATQAGGLQDSGIHRHFVTMPLTICPEASDFHERIDQLMLGNPDHAPPNQCRSLPAGAVLLTEKPGQRPTVEYRQFPIEQAMLPDGSVVWSDELGFTNVQLINGTVK